MAGLQVETDVPFTDPLPCGAGECAVPLDILAPEGGDGMPTIVLLPGGPGAFDERRYLEALATDLAQRDAVVFLATYRSEATGSSADTSTSDVRCAIRYARSRTGEFGGDPAEELRLAGFEAEYVELEGIDHFEIVDPGVTPEVVESILEMSETAGE